MELVWLLALLGACSDGISWAHDRPVDTETLKIAPDDFREWVSGVGDGYGSGSGYGYGYGYGSDYGDPLAGED